MNTMRFKNGEETSPTFCGWWRRLLRFEKSTSYHCYEERQNNR